MHAFFHLELAENQQEKGGHRGWKTLNAPSQSKDDVWMKLIFMLR
jgi:hypothetical protein